MFKSVHWKIDFLKFSSSLENDFSMINKFPYYAAVSAEEAVELYSRLQYAEEDLRAPMRPDDEL